MAEPEPNGPSRSRRSEQRQRQAFLIARCTPQEKQIALDYAQKQGLSLGDYLRQEVLRSKPLYIVRRSSARAEAILLLKAELGKIGSNINQVAKVANTTKSVDPCQIDALLEALNRCYEEIAKLAAT